MSLLRNMLGYLQILGFGIVIFWEKILQDLESLGVGSVIAIAKCIQGYGNVVGWENYFSRNIFGNFESRGAGNVILLRKVYSGSREFRWLGELFFPILTFSNSPKIFRKK